MAKIRYNSQQFPQLFTPFQLGKFTLQSRIVVTGHRGYFFESGMPTEDYGYYLRERAKGGAGLVTLGGCAVHPTSGTVHLNYDDAIIPRYQRVADLVHEYPVPVMAQMTHQGGKAGNNHRRALNGELLTMAPSPVPHPGFGYEQVMPHEMSIDEIEEIVDAFGQAARRIRSGGLDGAEVSVGSYGLMSQFLHGYSNRREDKYGGDTMEERATFMMEGLRAVRNALGPDLLMGVRLYYDVVDYSLVYEDLKTIAKLLESSGLLDYLNVWIGNMPNEMSNRYHIPPHYNAPGEFAGLAAGIKELVDLPVIGAGRINTPALAEEMLASGKMDLVGLVRELIADPYFPNKAKEGRVDDIRTCIACNQSCAGRGSNLGLPITCIYNPVTGHERDWVDPGPAPVKKKVVVVGGGPAGMEAARVAAQRGHQVVLFERSDRLGGLVKLAMKPPTRQSFEEIILFGEKQLPKLGVDVRLETEADVESILAEDPQAVIVATGSTPYMPEIPGVEGSNVLTVAGVLNEDSPPGNGWRSVDTQGTLPACLLADYLADQGKQVQIVTGLSMVGAGIYARAVWHHLYGRLVGKGVTMSPDDGRYPHRRGLAGRLPHREPRHHLAHRTGGHCGGSRRRPGQRYGLYRELQGKVSGLHAVGDCAQPRDIEMATYQAHKVALSL